MRKFQRLSHSIPVKGRSLRAPKFCGLCNSRTVPPINYTSSSLEPSCPVDMQWCGRWSVGHVRSFPLGTQISGDAVTPNLFVPSQVLWILLGSLICIYMVINNKKCMAICPTGSFGHSHRTPNSIQTLLLNQSLNRQFKFYTTILVRRCATARSMAR